MSEMKFIRYQSTKWRSPVKRREIFITFLRNFLKFHNVSDIMSIEEKKYVSSELQQKDCRLSKYFIVHVVLVPVMYSCYYSVNMNDRQLMLKYQSLNESLK